MSPQTANAAVAIIKTFSPRESYLVLRRAAHPEDPWSGHFSFPGGRKEKWDRTLLDTCIRETLEETGIALEPDQLKEELPLEPAGRNLSKPLWVQPFIFTIPTRPPLHLESKEIQSSCWLDSVKFCDLGKHRRVEMLPGHLFPAYPLDDYYLWGFTYRLLCSILHLEDQQI
ncbi:MAG: NUDIX hydrolase [Desulforhopalus sp.]